MVGVDIAVLEDDRERPTELGTARLVVPAVGELTSLGGMTEDPFAPPWDGCFEENLAMIRRVRAAPPLSHVAESPEFAELAQALEDRIDGKYYVFTPGADAD